MAEKKPYAYYKFIGVKPFTKLLDDSGIGYILFEDEAVRRLYEARPDYFNPADDTITVGKCIQDGVEVYFAEFGIKITKSYRSFIIFIYDHHPTFDDLGVSAADIDRLIQQQLEGVNIEEIRGEGN
jgi:hypothetical protein